jgi:hypothetical protein
MTIALLTIAYVLNVFLNRWLNKIMCDRDKSHEPFPFLWFFGFFCTAAFLILMPSSEKENWFTGKHWR